MKFVQGNLLEAPDQYLLQQCNCLTIRAHGLSRQISDLYPWANPYSKRTKVGHRNLAISENRPNPGSVHILDHPDEYHKIICLYGQWGPGTPGKYRSYPEWEKDTYESRYIWFKSGLDCLGMNSDIKTIAIPYKIGCGLAGGNWDNYSKLLVDFEHKYNKYIVCYKL